MSVNSCAYCGGETILPPGRIGLEKPYYCVKCHRVLSEKETVYHPFEIPTIDP